MGNAFQKARKLLVRTAKGLDKARVKAVKGFATVQSQAREFDQKTGLAKDPNWIFGHVGAPKKTRKEINMSSFEIDGLILRKKKKKK